MWYMITDELWAAMEPLVNEAKRHRGGQPPVLPDRMFFESVLYLARTGVPLRDLPGEFGAWDAVYNRFRRWVASGALARLFEATTADPQFGDVRRVLVDSTNMRAHRHAAGAPRKKAPRGQAVGAAAGAGTQPRRADQQDHPDGGRRCSSGPPAASIGSIRWSVTRRSMAPRSGGRAPRSGPRR